MAGKPVATLGSNHTCPMCSGTVPHVGGPIVQGAPNIFINGKPVASMGDMCACVGPPDTIVQGNPTVLINGNPIACIGDMTAHGGVIVSGETNVTIGSVTAEPPTATMPVKKIPFPEITFINKVLGNAKEAIDNQQLIREQGEDNEGEPLIYNLRWIKDETVIRESKVLKEVTLRASVHNIGDGESVAFKIKKPTGNSGEYEEFVELTGTVQDKMVEVIWEIEELDQNENNEETSQI